MEHKIKHLIKKFGFNQILKEIKDNDRAWRLPSLFEVREIREQVEYDVIWTRVEGLNPEDTETHAYLYNIKDDKPELCSKNHMHNVVVIRTNNV